MISANRNSLLICRRRLHSFYVFQGNNSNTYKRRKYNGKNMGKKCCWWKKFKTIRYTRYYVHASWYILSINNTSVTLEHLAKCITLSPRALSLWWHVINQAKQAFPEIFCLCYRIRRFNSSQKDGIMTIIHDN